MFRYQLLGILRRTDAHGYALAKEFGRLTGRRLSYGNVYRELQRLVAEGLVRQIPRGVDEDQRRAPYAITDSGSAAFEEWFCAIPRPTAPGDSELAERALFFTDVDPALARQVLDFWRSELWDLTKSLERELLQPPGEQDGRKAFRSLIRCRMRQIAAELELLDDLERVFSLPAPQAGASKAAPADGVRVDRRRAEQGASS